MLVVGDDVVDLHPEVAAGQLHGPTEVAEHRIHAPMVAGQLVTSRCVPDHVGVEQLPQGVGAASAEGIVALPDEILVGMPLSPLLLAVAMGRTITTGNPAHKS